MVCGNNGNNGDSEKFLVLGQNFSVAKTKCRVNPRLTCFIPLRSRRSLRLNKICVNLCDLWFNFFYLFSVVSVPSVAKTKSVLISVKKNLCGLGVYPPLFGRALCGGGVFSFGAEVLCS